MENKDLKLAKNKRISEKKGEELKFISLVAHELRTPITAVKWFMDILLKGKSTSLKKEQLELLMQINQANERMSKIINNLLEVCHIVIKKDLYISKKKISFNKLIKTISRECKLQFKKNNINFNIDEKLPEKYLVLADELKIYEVFRQLIDNAIKYSLPNTQVSLNVQKKSKHIIFNVVDRGFGIDNEKKSYIFKDLIAILNSSDLKRDGLGLGLFIARSIVESHGGELWFKSIKNKGTTFSFSLPILL